MPTLYAQTQSRSGHAGRSFGEVATTVVVMTICATITPSSRASQPDELKGLEPRSDLGPFWYWYTRLRKMNHRALDMRATARMVKAETRPPPRLVPAPASMGSTGRQAWEVEEGGGRRVAAFVVARRGLTGGPRECGGALGKWVFGHFSEKPCFRPVRSLVSAYCFLLSRGASLVFFFCDLSLVLSLSKKKNVNVNPKCI